MRRKFRQWLLRKLTPPPRDQSTTLALFTISHLPHAVQHLIIKRVTSRIITIAEVIALLITAWAIIDSLAFPAAVWGKILFFRSLAGAIIFCIALITKRVNVPPLVSVGMIIITLMLFYFYGRPPQHLGSYTQFSDIIAYSYNLLPFIIIAAIGMFPLTLIESSLLVSGLLGVYFAEEIYLLPAQNFTVSVSNILVMLVLGAVSMATSLYQLEYIVAHARLSHSLE